MFHLLIYFIGGVVSLFTSLGFVLAFGAIAVGLLGPIVMPALFRDRDSDPFDSAGGAMTA